jgi:hypothetical protein
VYQLHSFGHEGHCRDSDVDGLWPRLTGPMSLVMVYSWEHARVFRRVSRNLLVPYVRFGRGLMMLCHIATAASSQRRLVFPSYGSTWWVLGYSPHLADSLGGDLVVRPLADLLGRDLVVRSTSQTFSTET